MEVDCSLYDDLPNNQEKILHEVTKLQEQIEYLQAHIKSLENDVEKLCAKITEMKNMQKNLEKNISELYKTAKAEIDRKNRIISELRSQLDQYINQRRPNVASVKRRRDNSTDSHEWSYDSDPKWANKRHVTHVKERRGLSPYKKSRSRSGSKERRNSSHRERSKDRSRREQKSISSNEKYKSKLSEHPAKSNSHSFRDSFQKTKTKNRIEGERVVNKKVETKFEDTKINKESDSSKTSISNEVNPKGDVQKPVNKITNKNDTNKKNLTEKVVKDVLVNKENENAKNSITEKIEPTEKSEDFQQKTIDNKVTSEKVVLKVCQSDQSFHKISKEHGHYLLKSKYSALPVSINVTDLYSGTKKSEKSNNEVTECSKTVTIKGENEEKKLEDACQIKKEKFVNQNTSSIDLVTAELKANTNGGKAKIDTLRIEDVTKKLHKRLIETQKKYEENTFSSTSFESLPDQTESPPNTELLEFVKNVTFSQENEFTDNAADTVDSNKNVTSNQRYLDKSVNKEKSLVEKTHDDDSSKEKAQASNMITDITEEPSVNNKLMEIKQNIILEKKTHVEKEEKQMCEANTGDVTVNKGNQLKDNSSGVQINEHDKKSTQKEEANSCKRFENLNGSEIKNDKSEKMEIKNIQNSQIPVDVDRKKQDNKQEENHGQMKSSGNEYSKKGGSNIDSADLQISTQGKEECKEMGKDEKTTDIQVKNKTNDVPEHCLMILKERKNDKTISKNHKKKDSKDATDSKQKKFNDSDIKKETKEKTSNNKKDKHEDEIPESDRVLRSAARRNSCKEKLEKSINTLLENQENQKPVLIPEATKDKQSFPSNDSSVNLTHEGDIPVLHLSECADHPCNVSLFEMNISIQNCVTTSSPLNQSVNMKILKEDLNISLDQNDIQSTDKTCSSLNVTSKSVSYGVSRINSSSECKVLNTSSARKRRRVICTLID